VDYDDVLANMTRWTGSEDNVRALVLTGSAAAGTTHPLSDRDIEVYVTDVAAPLTDDSWWSVLGEVLVVERLHAPGWYPSRIVYYVGGKLDLSVIRVQELRAVVHDRPFVVLLDKDDRTGELALGRPQQSLPSAAEFDQALHWGYAAALMCAKAVVREEMRMAKVRDQGLKEQLLLLIEWDHRLRYGPDVDTRYLGTRIWQWMDVDVQDALRHCWRHFDAEDTAVALRAAVRLFADLSLRIAGQLGYAPFHHARLHVEIDDILSRRTEPSAH